MDEETYWDELEQEAQLHEVTEYDYANDWVNAGYQFTLNRIISNQTGGKKNVPY